MRAEVRAEMTDHERPLGLDRAGGESVAVLGGMGDTVRSTGDMREVDAWWMRTIIPNRKGVTEKAREERARFSNGVVLAGEHLFFRKQRIDLPPLFITPSLYTLAFSLSSSLTLLILLPITGFAPASESKLDILSLGEVDVALPSPSTNSSFFSTPPMLKWSDSAVVRAPVGRGASDASSPSISNIASLSAATSSSPSWRKDPQLCAPAPCLRSCSLVLRRPERECRSRRRAAGLWLRCRWVARELAGKGCG